MGSALRVALVSEHASPLAVLGGADAGGQNVYVSALARHLAELGCEVEVYTRDDGSAPARAELAAGVRVVHVPAGPRRPVPKDELFPYMRSFSEALGRTWAAWTPQVVHAHFWMSGWASLSAARPLGVPTVQTFHALGSVKRRHQQGADTSPAEREITERLLLRQVDRVVATCADEVAELRGLHADLGRIAVVPCGVDPAFRPEGPVDGTPRLRRHRIVVVGRLVPRKGVDDVIRALVHIPDAELVVAGGPAREELAFDHEAQRLRQIARALGVDDRVVLRGRVDRAQVAALVRSGDLVACAPWYEPFGIVPLEAMACGVPVVGTAVGGLLDTIVPGTTGVLVPPRRPDLLAPAMASVLGSTPRRRAMGRAAARRAERCYRWPTIAASVLDVYREVLDQATAGRAPAVLA